jgi:hypothetical protein
MVGDDSSIDEHVRASRRKQGLPDHIDDVGVLGRVARLLAGTAFSEIPSDARLAAELESAAERALQPRAPAPAPRSSRRVITPRPRVHVSRSRPWGSPSMIAHDDHVGLVTFFHRQFGGWGSARAGCARRLRNGCGMHALSKISATSRNRSLPKPSSRREPDTIQAKAVLYLCWHLCLPISE